MAIVFVTASDLLGLLTFSIFVEEQATRNMQSVTIANDDVTLFTMVLMFLVYAIF